MLQGINTGPGVRNENATAVEKSPGLIHPASVTVVRSTSESAAWPPPKASAPTSDQRQNNSTTASLKAHTPPPLSVRGANPRKRRYPPGSSTTISAAFTLNTVPATSAPNAMATVAG